jgi:hypothetical protein
MIRIALILRPAVFALIMLGAASASATSYPLYCRGGGSGNGSAWSQTFNAAGPFTHACDLNMGFIRDIVQGQLAERMALVPPEPGECRWGDRGFSANEPTQIYRHYVVNDCNRSDAISVGVTFGNGTATIDNVDVSDGDRDWGFLWGLTMDQNQYYTLSVHSDSGYLMIDQLLCSGWCG